MAASVPVGCAGEGRQFREDVLGTSAEDELRDFDCSHLQMQPAAKRPGKAKA